MIQNDKQTMSDIILSKRIYGFETFDDSFCKTKEYKQLMIELILNDHKYEIDFDLPYKTTSYIQDEAKKQLVSLFGDMDRSVPTLKNDLSLVYDYYATYGNITNDNVDDFVEYVNKNKKKIDIFDLPVYFDTGDQRNAYIKVFYFQIPSVIFKDFPVLYTGIKLIEETDILGVTTLAHEMIHGLTNRNKGIVKNYYLNEVLSIFVEMIISLSLDETKSLLEKTTKYRLLSTKADLLEGLELNFYDEIENTYKIYLISTLHAFSLFNKYIHSSVSAKKEILEEVKKVLNGEKYLEDFLKRFDVNEIEGSHIMSKQIKKLLK